MAPQISALLALTAWLGVGWAFGRRLLGSAAPRGLPGELLSIGLGLGIWMPIAYLLGTAGMATPGVFWVVLIGMGLWSHREFPAIGRALKRVGTWFRSNLRPPWVDLRAAAFWGLGILYGMMLLSALAPPTGMDTGAYHYTWPARWAQAGSLEPYDDLHRFGLGLFHLIYLVAFCLQGELLANLISATTAILAVLVLSTALARAVSGLRASHAALLVGGGPLLMIYGGTGYVEPPLTMFAALAILAMVLDPRHKRNATFVLTCLFTGLAVATKQTGVPMIVLLIPGAVALVRRGRSLRPLAFGAGLFLLITLLWPLWTASAGSPVSIPQQTADPLHQEMAGWPLTLLVGRFLYTVLVSGAYWSDSAGPAILFFGILVLFGWRHTAPAARRGLLLLVGALGLFAAGALALGPAYLGDAFNARYAAPMVLVMGGLAAAGGLARLQRMGRKGRVLAGMALVIPLVPMLLLRGGKSAVALPTALGLESREHYLSKKIESFPMQHRVNSTEGARVLFIGLRPYYLTVPSRRITDTSNLKDQVERFQATHLIHEYQDPGQRAALEAIEFLTPVDEARGTRLYVISDGAGQ